MKYPRSPSRTHLLLEPVQFMARLASLIPPPRHALVRYFGVLSSASKWRPLVVPQVPRGCAQAATRYLPWHELLRRVYALDSMLCPRCAGRLRFISLITEAPVVRKLLKALSLPFEPPVVPRARASTLFEDPPPPDYDAA